MNVAIRLPVRLASGLRAQCPAATRAISLSAARAAAVGPTVGAGPPPEAPSPEAANNYYRVERRRKQAQLLKDAKNIRNASPKKGGALKKRFWQDVHVKEVDGKLEIHLDSRPLRHPSTKEIVRIPASKPTLATALALEWDMLNSAQEATRQHLIPLTSLVCRALDIEADDASSTPQDRKIRAAIVRTVLPYLDTDSLLCWAPPAGEFDVRNAAGESLRDVQKKTAEDIIGYLTTNVWPGVVIRPVLDGESIMPRTQAEGVRETVQGWVTNLSAWELAGLERAVLAGKSLVAAARFVAEWSDGPVNNSVPPAPAGFNIEHAARATSIEVDWQTLQWGEVEDTHDVNKEDVKRQYGSVMLLVSGTGTKA